MLDKNCVYVSVKYYDNDYCTINPQNFTISHTAIVNMPTDPHSMMTEKIQSKQRMMNKLSEEGRTRKLKDNLPFIYYFFEMQKVGIETDDSNF